jgi:hypothetical protein
MSRYAVRITDAAVHMAQLKGELVEVCTRHSAGIFQSQPACGTAARCRNHLIAARGRNTHMARAWGPPVMVSRNLSINKREQIEAVRTLHVRSLLIYPGVGTSTYLLGKEKQLQGLITDGFYRGVARILSETSTGQR